MRSLTNAVSIAACGICAVLALRAVHPVAHKGEAAYAPPRSDIVAVRRLFLEPERRPTIKRAGKHIPMSTTTVFSAPAAFRGGVASVSFDLRGLSAITSANLHIYGTAAGLVQYRFTTAAGTVLVAHITEETDSFEATDAVATAVVQAAAGTMLACTFESMSDVITIEQCSLVLTCSPAPSPHVDLSLGLPSPALLDVTDPDFAAPGGCDRATVLMTATSADGYAGTVTPNLGLSGAGMVVEAEPASADLAAGRSALFVITVRPTAFGGAALGPHTLSTAGGLTNREIAGGWRPKSASNLNLVAPGNALLGNALPALAQTGRNTGAGPAAPACNALFHALAGGGNRQGGGVDGGVSAQGLLTWGAGANVAWVPVAGPQVAGSVQGGRSLNGLSPLSTAGPAVTAWMRTGQNVGSGGGLKGGCVGMLRWRARNDARGAVAADAVDVCPCDLSGGAAVCWADPCWCVAYTVGGRAMFRAAANPADWSSAPERPVGASGVIRGMAASAAGHIMVMVDDVPWVTRDAGATWQRRTPHPLGPQALLTSWPDASLFLVAAPLGSTMEHWVSRDAGATWGV